MIVEATKVCGGRHGCGQEKPVSEFYYSHNTADGFRTYCADCQRRNSAKYRNANPEAHREYYRKWARNDPLTAQACRMLQRAKHKGECDITHEWVMERLKAGKCAVTGIPFQYGTRHPFLPSIDRIDPTQDGHMQDNCHVILWCLNAFKGTASPAQFQKSLEVVARAVLDQG